MATYLFKSRPWFCELLSEGDDEVKLRISEMRWRSDTPDNIVDLTLAKDSLTITAVRVKQWDFDARGQSDLWIQEFVDKVRKWGPVLRFLSEKHPLQLSGFLLLSTGRGNLVAGIRTMKQGQTIKCINPVTEKA